jgi:hypothetical protein
VIHFWEVSFLKIRICKRALQIKNLNKSQQSLQLIYVNEKKQYGKFKAMLIKKAINVTLLYVPVLPKQKIQSKILAQKLWVTHEPLKAIKKRKQSLQKAEHVRVKNYS